MGGELQLGSHRWTKAGLKEWYFSSKSEAVVMAEQIAHRRLLRGYRVSAFG